MSQAKLILGCFFIFLSCCRAMQLLHQSENGNVKLAVILANCRDFGARTPFVQQSLVNSAIWTVKRLNFLNFLNETTFGVKIYETCREVDDLDVLLDLYKSNEKKSGGEEMALGVITAKMLNSKAKKLAQMFDLQLMDTEKCFDGLIRCAIDLVKMVVSWREMVTVVLPQRFLRFIGEQFAQLAEENGICVNDYFIYDLLPLTVKNVTGTLLIFGNQVEINSFLENNEDKSNRRLIFVPLDGAILTDLPPNAIAILPPHIPLTNTFKKTAFFATPLLFQVAIPLVNFAENLRGFLYENCNETTNKITCLKSLQFSNQNLKLEPFQILQLLKIEPLLPNFVYNVFLNDNSSAPYTKIMQYNFFWKNFTILDPNFNSSLYDLQNRTLTEAECSKNADFPQTKRNLVQSTSGNFVKLRTNSWIFIFLSISLLGILLSIAILLFFLVSIFRKDILEGNPLMTILLLLAVIFIYCTIVPMALEADNDDLSENICLARALTITLSFSSAFSLILSRSILLATAQKDTGFMAHLAGPVQSFLCLFIFGVQAALSLQVIGRCNDIFHTFSFMYLMSYNAMLILLLLCLTPLIYKCQRNYREGKYFTIAVGVISLIWLGWLPAFVFVPDKEVKEMILCFGLVSTATVLLGGVFVPRTYLMTIAAARDKLTSSLATSSAMDIYRSGTVQPVYDCVNVAAINAVNVSRMTTIQPSDLYTCPAFQIRNDNDEEEYEIRCDSPVSNDKVTRF